jgi:hypothetical protein
MKRVSPFALAVALAALDLSCASIGDPGGMSDGLPHGGTGEFRLLGSDETGIFGDPGTALILRGPAIESAMPVAGHLFYATAPVLETPPMLPMDWPTNEVFWDAFEPRRIHRGVARTEGVGAFDFGGEVLRASEAWEGTDVFDPWVTVDEDGTARLYYAAEGGIGLAEAPSVDGAFTKVGAGPVLGPEAALTGAPRRPSVVPGIGGGWWMFYDAGGELRAARSDDGRAFTAADALVFEGEDVGPSAEVAIAHPGAVTVETAGDRQLVRLYYESVRADGSHRAYVAGSDDGTHFVRYPRAVAPQVDMRFPVPLLVDDRVTLLYGNLPFFGGLFQTRVLVVSVAPAGVSFAPEMASE